VSTTSYAAAETAIKDLGQAIVAAQAGPD
jgi:hypothetical protein